MVATWRAGWRLIPRWFAVGLPALRRPPSRRSFFGRAVKGGSAIWGRRTGFLTPVPPALKHPAPEARFLDGGAGENPHFSPSELDGVTLRHQQVIATGQASRPLNPHAEFDLRRLAARLAWSRWLEDLITYLDVFRQRRLARFAGRSIRGAADGQFELATFLLRRKQLAMQQHSAGWHPQ